MVECVLCGFMHTLDTELESTRSGVGLQASANKDKRPPGTSSTRSPTDTELKPLLSVPSYTDRSGFHRQQRRQCIWIGHIPYSYSQVTLTNHCFSQSRILANILSDVKGASNLELNSCLVNVYRNGRDAVGWHSDDEKLFGSWPSIVQERSQDFIPRGALRPAGGRSQLMYQYIILLR